MSTPPSGTEGWGHGGESGWGASQWGSGITPPPGPPVITPLFPLPNAVNVPPSSHIFIRFTDDSLVGVAFLRVTVGAVIYVLGGVAQNGASIIITPNDGNGFDLELTLPETSPLNSSQAVTVFVKDNTDEIAELAYSFSVGVGPRLVEVVNPSPGILLAHFNEPMLQDDSLLLESNWSAVGVSEGAVPLFITNVFANQAQPNTATLHYEGGGSTYELSVINVLSQNLDELIDNSAIFELVYGQEEAPSVKLFDTLFGPVGIVQKVIKRRSMDAHVISMATALGMDEQFRLQFQTTDGTAGRNGKPGLRRIE